MAGVLRASYNETRWRIGESLAVWFERWFGHMYQEVGTDETPPVFGRVSRRRLAWGRAARAGRRHGSSRRRRQYDRRSHDGHADDDPQRLAGRRRDVRERAPRSPLRLRRRQGRNAPVRRLLSPVLSRLRLLPPMVLPAMVLRLFLA